MFSAVSQPSLKGALESVLTWTGSKSSRPAPEQKVWQNNRDIFSIVVTPDRIPKFCIPSLEVDHVASGSEEVGETLGKSAGSKTSGKMTPKPRPVRSKSEFCIRKEGALKRASWCRRETLCLTEDDLSLRFLERAGDHSDPVTRAALSLPHLPKITTPYGFLTLGESPNIRRKESLFFGCGSAELRVRLPRKKEATCLSQHPDTHLTVHHQLSCREMLLDKSSHFVPGGKLSNPQTLSPLPRGLTSERCTNKCEKKRFQQLMKRHLASIKRLSTNRRSGDRVVILTEKSLSSTVP
ncbi:hypothetical protein JRQ81_013108 [Phrynocephalus forsythii]|uniref:Uncharacterized protein n=1 Tax=Phrynocephalus forsythii TaxID=171643 RepID=A0A9Q0XZ70_9SAUR|nr:hypothetical protein JRQ81_013108 [Phrynocephalus forsythii]